MLVSDMQRAIGEEIFAIPEFANWASKIASSTGFTPRVRCHQRQTQHQITQKRLIQYQLRACFSESCFNCF
jgi:hypothetical protein